MKQPDDQTQTGDTDPDTIMTFKDREKRRLGPLKRRLFSKRACRNGIYRGKRRDFCLHEGLRAENLEAGIRDAALTYLEDCAIRWHDGKGKGPSRVWLFFVERFFAYS